MSDEDLGQEERDWIAVGEGRAAEPLDAPANRARDLWQELARRETQRYTAAMALRSSQYVATLARRNATVDAPCPYCAALDLDTEDDGLCWTCRGRWCEVHFAGHDCTPRAAGGQL